MMKILSKSHVLQGRVKVDSFMASRYPQIPQILILRNMFKMILVEETPTQIQILPHPYLQQNYLVRRKKGSTNESSNVGTIEPFSAKKTYPWGMFY